MKICLASHTFLPQVGGTEIAMHGLATEFMKSGEQPFVYTSSRNKLAKSKTDYPVLVHPKIPRGYFEGLIFAANLYILQKKYNFDVIHIHKAQMAYYAAKIKSHINAPLLVTTHGGDVQTLPELNYGDRLNSFWKPRIEYALRHADLLISISTATKREYLGLGVREERIVDIPNGIDLGRFKESCRDIREILGLPEKIRIFLSVGRYHEVKGYEYLLRAIQELSRLSRDFRVLIIGKYMHKLKDLVDDLGIKDRLVFLDLQKAAIVGKGKNGPFRFPDDVLLSAYKTSDIYVCPSLMEGFSLSVLEAMAAGLPLIATRIPGNEDIIHESNAISVPPGDHEALFRAMFDLLQNSALRTSKGRGASETVRSYDLPLIAERHMVAYREAIRTFRLGRIHGN